MVSISYLVIFFFFSSRRRHTRFDCDWSSDVCSSDLVPEALALMNLKLGGPLYRPDLSMATEVSTRLRAMDEQGIDVEALSINPNWYTADRDLAQIGRAHV